MTSWTALAEEIDLAAAAEHARSGDLDAALRLLRQSDVDSVARLDLLARVHAQRGELEDADTAWQRLLAIDPENPRARAGRELIARIAAGRRRARPVPPSIWAGAVAVVLVGASVVLVSLGGPDAGAPQPGSPATAQAPASDQVASMEAERAQQRTEEGRARERLVAIGAELSGPGVHVTPREHDIQVVFDGGLFRPNGTELTADGNRELRGWATRLAGKPVTIAVLGHGVRVSGGPATGGSAIALSRAVAAIPVLAQASGLPLTAFSAASADQSAPPHPEADPSRNRSITVLVTPGTP